MRKKIAILIMTLLLTLGVLSGCGNHTILDTTFSYDYAQVLLSDGTLVEGKVESWSDYEGDQIQIKIDGVTYLVHIMNATLIAK